MQPADWPEVERLYHASLELQPEDRAGFLVTACPDLEMRRDVEALLAHRCGGASLLDKRALDVAAEMAAGIDNERLVGSAIARYEVLSIIGSGGMGVVYRGRDARLERDVALKVLPEELSRDPDRQIRYEREARLLASLNHPNIGEIYDFVESESIRCLVLELVEGETLAERLNRGPVPVSEALLLCREIADALEAAHEQGIVHRDLKPANVMVTPDGHAKVLDFGIAKLMAANSESPSTSGPATIGELALLGTPSYMSPEQARGKSTDERTDIWAFGCILYEMLAGSRAYEGDSIADTLASILEREPDWTVLPKTVSPAVANLVRRCLEKDPHWRLRDIGDARIELAGGQSIPSRASKAGRRRDWLLWAAGFILLAALLTAWRLRSTESSQEMRVELTTPPTTDPVSLAISPDGRTVAFVGSSEGRSRLWLRSLSSTSPLPLEGTDNASCPFWSPDSKSVGFFAGGKLKRIDVDSGSVRILAVSLGCGGAWNADGTILFSGPIFGAISRIDGATGVPGEQIAVTLLDRPRQTAHRLPQFLPDGRHFLYYAAGTPESRGVYAGDLNGSQSPRLIDTDSAAVYGSSGHLFFVRHGTLFAQTFDPTTMRLSGEPVPLDGPVAFDPTRYMAAVSASSTGVLVYRSGATAGRRHFVWLDRSGKEIAKVGDPDGSGPLDPSLSPDEQQLAFHRTINGRPDIWFLDTHRSGLSRFTSEENPRTRTGVVRPIWSPDGTQMVFAAITKKVTDLFRRSVSGGNAELLLESDQPKAATDWSIDGRFVLYRSIDPRTGWDIWALPIDAAGRPGASVEILRTNFDETNGQISPDSKWVAYESNETGRSEIYVRAFPEPGNKSPVSRDGGAQVRWRRDGMELFYLDLDDRLIAVPIRSGSDGESIEIGTASPLFATQIGGAVQGANRQQYVVSSDGQRFLVNALLAEPTSSIKVLLNWKANGR